MKENTVADIKQAVTPGPFALPPNRFKRDAAYVVRISHATVPAGIPLETLTKPETWAHIARDLVQGQRILVDAADGAYSAQLKVHQCTSREAIVVVEWSKHEKVSELPDALSAEDQYRTHFVPGGEAKWRNSRLSDNVTISEGHATKEIARAALRGHLQAMAA